MTEPRAVVISRTTGGWQAELGGAGVVTARSLTALDVRVRARLSDRRIPYVFHTGNTELDRLVRRLRIARTMARQYEATVRRLLDEVVLRGSGLSQRDLAMLVGLSHQRIYQLVERSSADRGERSGHR